MREIICINIGQAGVQLSNAAWELFCIEHGIEATGLLRDAHSLGETESFRTFFQEVPTGQFVPRAVSIDLEPTVIDEIRTGPYRSLFHPDQLISSMEDGANNFARGCFTIGKRQIDRLTNTVRKLVDACESLQGFFFLHSVTGGTGSGFTTLALQMLTLEYTKRGKFQMSIFPSPILSNAIVEPYNSVLSSVRCIENVDLTNIMDNEAIYGICTRALNVTRPTFNNLNRVISQVFSDMTASLRFDSTLNSDLDQMCTNLIPFPRIHFPITCHAPLISANKADHEPLSTTQLTKSCFDKDGRMVSCAMEDGKYMCCVLMYRGKITPKDVNYAIADIKRKNDIKFVDWCPTGFKLGINSQPPICVAGSEIAQSDKSVTMLANSTSSKETFEKLMYKFDILFSKRSFIHWYVGEGMEEGEFNEARDELNMIYTDYAELEGEEEEGEEEEEGGEVPPEEPKEKSVPPEDAEPEAAEEPELDVEPAVEPAASSISVEDKQEEEEEVPDKEDEEEDDEETTTDN